MPRRQRRSSKCGSVTFIDAALRKVERVRRIIDASGRDIRLQVDGGIKVENIRRIADAGPTPSSPAARCSERRTIGR